MADGQRTIRIRFDGSTAGLRAATKDARRQVEQVRDDVDRATTRIGIGIGARIGGAFAGVFKTLPLNPAVLAGIAALGALVTPTIGAAVSAGVLLGLGGGVLAAGIIAAAQSKKVKKAWGRFGKRAKDALSGFTDAFKGPLIRAADTFGDLLKRLEPTFTRIGKAMAPVIDRLVPAFAKLAENAMPGVERALKASIPLFDTLADHAPAIGKAVSDFFDEIAKAAPGADAILDDVLSLVEDLIPKVGRFIRKLSEIHEFFDKKIGPATSSLRKIWNKWVADFRQLKKAVQPFIDELKKIVGPIIKDGLKDLKAAWADLQKALKDKDVRTALKALAVVLGVILGAAIVAIIMWFRLIAFILRRVVVPAFKFLAKIATFEINLILDAVQWFLRGLKAVVDIAAKIPGPHQAAMRKVSRALDGAIAKVKGLKRALNAVPDRKHIDVRITNRGRFLRHVRQMRRALRGLTSQGVRVAGVTGRGGFSEFHTGGVVPGPRGQERLILAQGGETVRTPEQERELHQGDEFVATATIDLGEGISQVVDLKFRRKMRGLRRSAIAGAGAMA